MRDPAATPRQRGVLIAVVASTLVLTSDVTAMGVALPRVERVFETSLVTAQWVMNAYLLAFGMSIVTGGWMSDQLGRRRVLTAGLAVFGGFAFLGGLAPSIGVLIPLRAVQGVGAGLIWPAVVGLAFTSVAPGRRLVAVGLALGAAGLGEALGPLAGGVVSDDLSWRWILLAKPALAGVALACVRLLPPDPPSRAPGRVDRAGIATLSFAVLALLYALDEVVGLGLGSPKILGALVAAAALLGAFVVIERQVSDRLLPREVMGDRRFLGAGLLMATTAPLFFVALLYVPQLLQKFLGFGVLETGVAMLPMQLVFALSAPVAGLLATRVGLKLPHAVGLALMAGSGAAFALFDPAGGYAGLLPGMALYGIGVGLAYPAVTALALTALDRARAGLAAGMLFMVELVTGAVMTAVATTVVATTARARLVAEVPAAGFPVDVTQERVLAGVLAGTDSAVQVMGVFGGDAHRAADLAERAFFAGAHRAFAIVAALAALGALIALVVSPGRD